MMDEPESQGPLEPMAPLEPLPPPPPQRDPFWSYGDLLIFAGLAIPCMLLGFGAVKGGVGLAVAVLLLGALIHTPRTENPLTDLLKDPTSLALLAIFGTIVAPVCEELVFRGFLHPVLVRSLGAFAGILATAVPFGMLHFSEYGNSWRHVLLISISGVAFGWMRQVTGSTKAAAGMHSAYNAFQFVLLIMAKNLPQ